MKDREPPDDSDTVPPESFRSSAGSPRSSNDEFIAFYREDMPRLIGFLMYQGAPLDQASDIAQEAMARAFRLWESIEHPAAWVRRVAGRELVRRIADVRDNPVEEITDSSLIITSSTNVADWEERHEILRAIKQLPPRQRQVIAWALDGYSPAEIASQLNITPEAVRASLMKARRGLSKSLLPQEDR